MALPSLLVSPDLEFVGVGRRRPVHPAEVVAHHVRPQRDEVLGARGGDHAVAQPGERLVATAADREGRGGVDGREDGDDELGRRPGRRRRANPNGSVSSHEERADPQGPAAGGGQPVADLDATVGADGADRQPGPDRALDRIDASSTGGSLRVPRLVTANSTRPAPPTATRGGLTRRDTASGPAGHRTQTTAKTRRAMATEARTNSSTTPSRRPAPKVRAEPTSTAQPDRVSTAQPALCTGRASGWGTWARTSAITDSAVDWAARAAGESISRWASTGAARALMSSGVT